MYLKLSMYKIDKTKHLSWLITLFTKTNLGFWTDFMLISQLGEQSWILLVQSGILITQIHKF